MTIIPERNAASRIRKGGNVVRLSSGTSPLSINRHQKTYGEKRLEKKSVALCDRKSSLCKCAKLPQQHRTVLLNALHRRLHLFLLTARFRKFKSERNGRLSPLPRQSPIASDRENANLDVSTSQSYFWSHLERQTRGLTEMLL